MHRKPAERNRSRTFSSAGKLADVFGILPPIETETTEKSEDQDVAAPQSQFYSPSRACRMACPSDNARVTRQYAIARVIEAPSFHIDLVLLVQETAAIRTDMKPVSRPIKTGICLEPFEPRDGCITVSSGLGCSQIETAKLADWVPFCRRAANNLTRPIGRNTTVDLELCLLQPHLPERLNHLRRSLLRPYNLAGMSIARVSSTVGCDRSEPPSKASFRHKPSNFNAVGQNGRAMYNFFLGLKGFGEPWDLAVPGELPPPWPVLR